MAIAKGSLSVLGEDYKQICADYSLSLNYLSNQIFSQVISCRPPVRLPDIPNNISRFASGKPNKFPAHHKLCKSHHTQATPTNSGSKLLPIKLRAP